MYEYDVALKLLLRETGNRITRHLSGTAVQKWINVELPVQNISEAPPQTDKIYRFLAKNPRSKRASLRLGGFA